MKFFPLLIPLFLLTGCAGDNWDEAAFPPDQVSAELAYKRLADHGDLEPVLREGQPVDGWQFHVSGHIEVLTMDSEPVMTVNLRDRSGITYKVTSETSPDAIGKITNGSYGFGRGRVHAVDRDLAAGKIDAELLLSDWTVRED